METEDAPNWDRDQVLTWSGKWHIANDPESPDRMKGYRRTFCGAYGYTRDHVPNYVGRLQAIKKGIRKADVCKKCERSAAAVPTYEHT